MSSLHRGLFYGCGNYSGSHTPEASSGSNAKGQKTQETFKEPLKKTFKEETKEDFSYERMRTGNGPADECVTAAGPSYGNVKGVQNSGGKVVWVSQGPLYAPS